MSLPYSQHSLDRFASDFPEAVAILFMGVLYSFLVDDVTRDVPSRHWLIPYYASRRTTLEAFPQRFHAARRS